MKGIADNVISISRIKSDAPHEFKVLKYRNGEYEECMPLPDKMFKIISESDSFTVENAHKAFAHIPLRNNMKKVTLKEITQLVKEKQPFKIKVTKDTSAKIQQAVFAGGGKWISESAKGEQKVLDLTMPNMFIYFDNGEGDIYLYTIWSESTQYEQVPVVEFDDSVFTLDDRYIVLKRKDVEEYLMSLDEDHLSDIVDTINRYRIEEGRGQLQCVVVEKDWPEYEKVVEMLEARIAEESKIKTLPEFMAALASGKTLIDNFGNVFRFDGPTLLINNKPSSSYYTSDILNLTELATRKYTIKE